MAIVRCDMGNEGRFTVSNLIVCEGKGDAAFFRHLLDENNISDFKVEVPNTVTAKGQFGNSGFGTYLVGIKTRRGFGGLTNVIIARDSDENPEGSFNQVCEQIQQAGGYEIPNGPRKTTDTDKKPAMTVLLIPGSQEPGNLETLLLQGVDYRNDPNVEDCLDKYFQCLELDKFSKTISSKKKMTTIIAATNNKNPSCSLAYIWSHAQAECNPISIQSPAISNIVEFLRSFSG